MTNETTASQPKSIGDDAQFIALMNEWDQATHERSDEVFDRIAAYVHEYFRAPAAQASATIQAAPTDEATLMARAEGRAEVVQMILGMSAETPLEEFTDWGTSGAPEDEGSAYWKADELRAHFACDDKLFNLFERAESMYWEALSKSDEAERMRLMVKNSAVYQPLYDFLTKHQEWDLMHSLQSSAATIQEPVMVAEPVGAVRTELGRAAFDAAYRGYSSSESWSKSDSACYHHWTHLAGHIWRAALAAPMVADPAGVTLEMTDAQIDDAICLVYATDYQEDSAAYDRAVVRAALAALAATVKAVPSEALELAGMVVKATFGDHKILVPRVDLSGKGIGTLVYFAAPLADKTGGGE